MLSGIVILIVLIAIILGVMLINFRIRGGTREEDRVMSEARYGHRLETLMLYYLNKYSHHKFTEVKGGENSRLPWLYVADKSAPDGKVYLDLDAYCPKCRVAFEFNGPIHYKFPGGDLKKWQIGRYNDLRKKELCEQNGVKLFIIQSSAGRAGIDKEYLLSRLFDVGCLDREWLTSRGERKGFAYKGIIGEPVLSDIKKIKSVLRFTENGPTIIWDA